MFQGLVHLCRRLLEGQARTLVRRWPGHWTPGFTTVLGCDCPCDPIPRPPLALALVLGAQDLVTRIVSWHWALYRAFFRVPWRALVPLPPSHAPQLSNLYLQSAGGRGPSQRVRRCVRPHTRPPPPSPPNSFFQLQGTRQRMRCVCAPQVPSRKPAPQSLLLGMQGPQVHSAHSLPALTFLPLSAGRGQSSGCGCWGSPLGVPGAP